MKKPKPTAIAAAVPLTTLIAEGNIDRVKMCGLCRSPSETGLDVMRECGLNDKPLAGLDALIFVGRGDAHKPCRKAVDDHPRLYETVQAQPGQMAKICGDCIHRKGLRCAHPGARANGGPGIEIKMRRPAPFQGVVCIRGPKGKNLAPPREGVACSGRET